MKVTIPLSSRPANRDREDPFGELCRALSETLGEFGYQWLCACAVFPGLHLALTTHLGEVLADTVGRARPTEKELLAICRLPWFRRGLMPDDLRARLAHDIAKPFSGLVRDAVARFVFAGLPNQSSSTNAVVPLSLIQPPADWPMELDTWVALGSIHTGPDNLLCSFMQQRPIGFKIGKFGLNDNRRQSWKSASTVAAILGSAGAAACLWWFAEDAAHLIVNLSRLR